jgi:hypothetical protein
MSMFAFSNLFRLAAGTDFSIYTPDDAIFTQGRDYKLSSQITAAANCVNADGHVADADGHAASAAGGCPEQMMSFTEEPDDEYN